MRRSTDRILTTHVGSLPRPDDLLEVNRAKVTGESFDERLYAQRLTAAVSGICRRQAALGPHAVGIARSAIGRPAATISIACDGGSGREVEVLGCRFVLQRRD